MHESTKGTFTVAQCISTFLSDEQNAERKKIFTESVGAKKETVENWVLKGITPIGIYYIKSAAFFTLVGYDVFEFTSIDQSLITAAQYIMLEVITIEQIVEQIGASSPDRIREYMRGQNGISAGRVEKLLVLLDNKRTEFEHKKQEFITRLSQVLPAGYVQNLDSETQLINSFADACQNLRTIGNKLLNSSRDTRFNMRAKIGVGKEPLLHTTWEVLDKLLSERGEINS